MAAQIEEVVVDADAGDSQSFGEQRAEDLLLRSAGSMPFAGGGEVGSRERFAVELAVGGQRQGVQGEDGGGKHVVGEAEGEVVAERRGVQRAWRDVGDQALIAG